MLVFTNGCFDILHVGHIAYLEQSRALGKYLIVGLNSDASVRRLKGATRPINTQEDRKRMLLALRCVDAVYIFDEDTPLGLIKRVKPDIITKGGDYRAEDVVGHGLAKVVILPYVEGKSTTGVIDACRGQGLGLREDLGRRADVLWKGIGL
jgi:D-beta-D-heptose 7-phosphate kinase/D-beta-D-heptose 1-phosphate adenosyltransferase